MSGIVGRDAELASLRHFVASVFEGAAALAFQGEAGVGKTTLWRAGVAAAEERGLCVLQALPAESETALSFSGIGDLLDPVLDDALGPLPAGQRRALSRALILDDDEGPSPDPHAVGIALLNAFRSLAEERPLIVAVDDVQWLDPASSGALAYAGRRLRAERVGVLLARRLGLESSLLVECLRMFDRKRGGTQRPAVELGRMRPKEVSMRPPSVFVRPLTPAEGERLKRLSKRAKHFSTRQRAAIVLASATGLSAAQVARALLTDESHVREVIHDFNERGFDSLVPNWRGGRPRRISDDERARIVAVAGARPDQQGVPLTRWSLRRLSRFLAGQGITVSPAQLGRILARAGLSFQRTRSWKASPDPAYEAKAARVLALCRERPKDGVVIAFDEMGPLSLCPQAGAGWASPGRPERQRATYTRRSGVRQLLAAYDVHADRLRGRLRPRKTGAEVLTFMRTIRAAYPSRLRLYWIQDNLSCHWTPPIRAWAAANNVELVPTPTYASYLNPVECHFLPISEFVCKNADYLDWDAFGHALAQHIRYRNDPAQRDERLARAERRRQVTIAA